MALMTKFDVFTEDLATGVHNFGADTFKAALTNTAPNASTGAVIADITQISSGNGYTTGGVTFSLTSAVQTSGTFRWIVADISFTAAGGSMAGWRYIVVYNYTANRLIGYYDYGSTLVLASGETFTGDADPSTGILRIT